MSTKRDPVIAVIKYFEEADLALATQALALCQQTLRRRRGPQQQRLKVPPTRRVLPSVRKPDVAAGE